MIITCASQKGGVCKTTAALAVAALLAHRHRVAFIDLDKEGFATTMGLGRPVAPDPLSDEPHAIRHTASGGGELLLFASGISIGLAHEQILTRHIARAARVADIVVIDTPPDGRSPAVAAALRAASLVLAPVIPEFQSVAGMQRLAATAASLQVRAPIRVLLSRWEARTRLAQDVHQQLVAANPGLTLSSVVPRDQRAAEAMAAACPLPIYAPRSAASAAYRTAVYELAALTGLHIPQGAI